MSSPSSGSAKKTICPCNESSKLFFKFFVHTSINRLNLRFRNKNSLYTKRGNHGIEDKFPFGLMYRGGKYCIFQILFHVTNIRKISLKTSKKDIFFNYCKIEISPSIPQQYVHATLSKTELSTQDHSFHTPPSATPLPTVSYI